jgi:uncharacterized RDD family membrane protein YckC
MKRNHHAAAAFACVAILLVGGATLRAQSPWRVPGGRATAAPVSVALGAARLQEPGPDREFYFPGPIVRVGQDYTVRAGEVVRDVRVVFGDVNLAGRVERDMVVVLGTIHVAGSAVVEGSLVVVGGSATIDQGAAVHRDLVVLGGSLTAPPDFAPGGDHVAIGSPAAGHAIDAFVPWILRGLLWGRPIVPDLGWVWLVVGLVFLVLLAVNALFDGAVRAVSDVVIEKPASAFLMGLLVLVLTVPVIAILAVTVIGIAVIPFLLCAMFVGGLVGKAAVARALGRRLVAQSAPDSRLQSLRSFVLGSFVICLAYMVPVLGLVTWALTGLLAVGAVSVTFGKRLRREHPQKPRAVAAPAGQAPAMPVAEHALSSVPEPPLADDGPVAPPPAAVPGDLVTYPRATFLDRVVAFALDCVLVGIAVGVLDLSRHDGAFPLLLLVYHIVFWAWRGTTLGGIVVGLRVVRTEGGPDLRFVDAVVRGLSSVFSLAALGIGCFWMLQDPARQMWHDKIAGTVVAKVPRALVLP